MLFSNPDILGVFVSFNFKAYGGAILDRNFMGERFMGEFNMIDAFKTIP